MFNLQPGAGLGFTGSKQVAFGLGLVLGPRPDTLDVTFITTEDGRFIVSEDGAFLIIQKTGPLVPKTGVRGGRYEELELRERILKDDDEIFWLLGVMTPYL